MAFPTAVNDQITDSVTQANVKVLGDAPAVAMGNLFQATAQALHRMDRGRFAPSIEALREAGKLEADAFVDGVSQGYRYQLTCSKDGRKWMATAAPVEPGTSGTRYFAINQAEQVVQSDKPFVHRDDCVLGQK